jgi:hypothetical protein
MKHKKGESAGNCCPAFVSIAAFAKKDRAKANCDDDASSRPRSLSSRRLVQKQ